jgi:hypothetical protein
MGLGIQTTHRETMKIINREWDPDQVSAVLDKVNRHDHCLYGIEIIMGLPGDDLETFKKSVTWAYARRPISIFAFIFQVLPGSPLEREQDRYGIRDGGIEGLHQIESNNTFPAEQIQVGKAMRFWNRIMQQAFYRLVKVTGLPGGDLLEKWTLHARDAGLEEHLPTMQMNRFDRDLLARLAREFGSFCKDVLSAGGLPDVSKRLQEFLRYCFVRRSVAEPTATFFHVMDVYGITIREEDNRIDKMEALGERKLPEDAPRETFTFDMRELWPLTTAEAMSSLAEEPHTYVFMTLEDGGALAVEV